MADELFNLDNLNNARGTTQAMVDNLQELRKLGGEFAGEFGRDFLSNANAINKAFNDAIGKAEQFNTLEVSRKEALNVEKKLREEIGKSEKNLLELTNRVDATLKSEFDRTTQLVAQKRAAYNQAVQQYGVDSNVAKLAETRLDRAEALNKEASQAYELGLETINLTEKQIEEAKKLQLTAAQYAENWDKANLALGVVGKLVKGIGKIPIVGDLFNANKALAVMQKEVIKGKNTFKAFGEGISAAFQGLEKSTVILAVIGAVVKALQFMWDLLKGAQETTIGIARNLGITRDSAQQTAQRFANISENSKNVLVNVKNLAEAQQEFAKAAGATTITSAEFLENQVFLTKNLKLSGEAASNLGLLLKTSGQNSQELTNSIIETNNETVKTNGYLISSSTLLEKISSTSAEIAGYYKFSAENLAEAVRQTTRFGISLQQASTIAKGLLDFETSISAELEAELLTGREFNFELARSKALQGDVAGAASEVLKQMQSLTEEQRRSPIIMESLAKATGLSVEELNKAYLLQKNLNMSTKEYEELLSRAGKTGNTSLVEQLGLQGASREEIEKTLSVQEAFAAALEKAKEQFAYLVDQGVLYDLVDILSQLTVKLKGNLDFFGIGVETRRAREAEQITGATKGAISADEIARLQEIASTRTGILGGGLTGGKLLGGWSTEEEVESAKAQLRLYREGSMDADDFTIRTNPKDTLVMAGGTKFGEETNALLKELISAVKTPNNQVSQGQIAQAVAVNMGVYERGVN